MGKIAVIGVLAALSVAVGMALPDAQNTEAHVARSFARFNIPNGTGLEITSFPASRRYLNDDGGGCEVSVPAGLIPVPPGATSVTVPAGHNFDVAEIECEMTSTEYDNGTLYRVQSFTVSVAGAGFHIDEHQHNTAATGVISTGFYCGRRYDWRDFAADAQFPMYITPLRRSLLGWVYVDSSGQQVARCAAYPPIYRPAGQ